MLDAILDEQQRKQSILALDDSEQIVFDSYQDFGKQILDLSFNKFIKLHLFDLADSLLGFLFLVECLIASRFGAVVLDERCKLLIHELHLLSLPELHALQMPFQFVIFVGVFSIVGAAHVFLLVIEVVEDDVDQGELA